MAREVLSLKSIYKFLTINDYPVYSEGIIKKDNRAGLTLNKFYLENILTDFKNQKTGKIIWRTEGSRNRYISAICNRSDQLSIYKEYAKEVMQAADYDTVLRQIRQYMSFLLERQYNVENFFKKIPAILEMYEDTDDTFTQEASVFFQNALEERKSLEGLGLMVDTFYCAWILTLFTIHALMGNGEGEEYLHQIRSDKQYSLLEMFKRYQNEDKEPQKEVLFLTEVEMEFLSQTLKAGHFFGREEELFELRELLLRDGFYLISAPKGSGKTELMRQFVKQCIKEKLADAIGIISGEEELLQKLETLLQEISVLQDKKTLFVFDDLWEAIGETELELLYQLPATVFITTEAENLEKFKTYRLKPIGQNAASLIFRDNYGSCLNKEDRAALEEILRNPVWRNPMKLRQIAQRAKKEGWSVQKIKEMIHMQ